VLAEYGAFAEYVLAPENMCVKIPTPDTKFMTIFSAVTASIGLEQVGEMKKGETVLVTAAAGGTGQFAVQFAKLAGCHVIGTCSSPSKVEFLKSIGCDRVINYKSENLRAVLKKEYSRGFVSSSIWPPLHFRNRLMAYLLHVSLELTLFMSRLVARLSRSASATWPALDD
jgi:NADPH-dependent curcumin reductase CurA